MHQNLDSPNFRNVVDWNDWSPMSKRCFSVTTGLISFTMITVSNLALRKKELNQISVIWFSRQKSRQSQYSNIISMTFYLLFIYHYRPNFFQQDLNWNPQSVRREGFNSQVVDIDTCIRILIVQKFKKKCYEKCFFSIIEKVFFRNEWFDLLQGGHNHQLYHLRKRFDKNFRLLVFSIKIRPHPKVESFLQWIMSTFSLTILFNNELEFFHHGLKTKFDVHEVEFN